ncbi:MAG: acyl--CoA ligase, partial [Pseudomonadales bacterium]|nr:acyl--CoA ligase [Pseudomonadales bacterium]
MDIRDIRRATARLTGEGQPYEMGPEVIDGVTFDVFRHAPVNLRELFRSSLEHAQRDFYVFQEQRWTFAQTWERAAEVANALLREGVQPGDRIAIAARNYPEWIFAFMGITSIGATAVCMNAWWTTEELAYGLTDSGTRLVFADSERLERLRPLSDTHPVDIVTMRTPHDPADSKVRSFEAFIAGASNVMPEPDVHPDANATILYTSGSTAHPKGVLATHRSIIHAVLGWECGAAIAVELSPELADPSPEFHPAMMLAVPLFHVAGLNVQFMSSFRGGRKLVGMYKWDPEAALRLIQDERITGFNGVPTMSWELVQSPDFDKYDLRSLKSAGGGGAAMAPEHSRQINRRLTPNGGVAGTGYGMTETNGLGTSISGADLLERPRSAGRPIPPVVTIRVVDPAGNEVPRGQTGEIWFKGAMNFRGYWNNPKATAETLSDGWVHSGDIGHMDEQDFVFITDRAKDMIIR